MANGPHDKMSPAMLFVILIALGATFYMMFDYIGPYQWAAELQLKWFESYSEKITFLVTFLLLYGAIMLLTFPLRTFFPALGTGKDVGDGQLAAGWVFLLVIGAGFAGFGLFHLCTATSIGGLRQISVRDLEAGNVPASRYVSATGFPLGNAGVTFGSGSSSSSRKEDLYVPFTSGQADPRSTGVHLFLKLKHDALPSGGGGPMSFSGILEKNDLPGPVRTHMEQTHNLLANDYYVLEVGETPKSKQSSAKIMAWVGGAMAGLGLIVGAFGAIKRKLS